MYASLLGLSITVEMLLKRGANPQLTDSNGHTGMLGKNSSFICEQHLNTSISFNNLPYHLWIYFFLLFLKRWVIGKTFSVKLDRRRQL